MVRHILKIRRTAAAVQYDKIYVLQGGMQTDETYKRQKGKYGNRFCSLARSLAIRLELIRIELKPSVKNAKIEMHVVGHDNLLLKQMTSKKTPSLFSTGLKRFHVSFQRSK